jgi:hypothetical protein
MKSASRWYRDTDALPKYSQIYSDTSAQCVTLLPKPLKNVSSSSAPPPPYNNPFSISREVLLRRSINYVLSSFTSSSVLDLSLCPLCCSALHVTQEQEFHFRKEVLLFPACPPNITCTFSVTYHSANDTTLHPRGLESSSNIPYFNNRCFLCNRNEVLYYELSVLL